VSRDTQVGPLTVNTARLATVPAELAQFLNITCREQLTLAAATDDFLERLVPVVRTGVVTDDEPGAVRRSDVAL
jgi:hypothetical protein